MKGCIFCESLKQRNDRDALILYRGKQNFILLNKYPYNPGHLMIAPFSHIDSIEKADKPSTDEMTDLTKQAIGALRRFYKPQGFNMGMNIGKTAGAGVEGHFHMHIVPRWMGDSNFMPIIGSTKVVIEDIYSTFDQLAPLFGDFD